MDLTRHVVVACVLLLVFGGACGSGGANQYSTGPFSISYDPEALPALRVKWQNNSVWFSSPSPSSKPILYAEMVSMTQEQIGGDFSIKSKVTASCTKLNISSFSSSPGSPKEEQLVVLQGTLCDKILVELVFQAVTVQSSTNTYDATLNHSHLLFRASMAENSYYNSLRLVYGSQEDEKFYGFGAQYSRLNMKGQRLPLFLSEQGVGRGLEPITVILDAFSRNAGKGHHITCISYRILDYHCYQVNYWFKINEL